MAQEPPPPPNPFDHPWFLPVVLFGFALWFGYDGWFNEDMEWIKFNRGGFAVCLVAGAYYTWRALQERGKSDPGS